MPVFVYADTDTNLQFKGEKSLLLLSRINNNEHTHTQTHTHSLYKTENNICMIKTQLDSLIMMHKKVQTFHKSTTKWSKSECCLSLNRELKLSEFLKRKRKVLTTFRVSKFCLAVETDKPGYWTLNYTLQNHFQFIPTIFNNSIN